MANVKEATKSVRLTVNEGPSNNSKGLLRNDEKSEKRCLYPSQLEFVTFREEQSCISPTHNDLFPEDMMEGHLEEWSKRSDFAFLQATSYELYPLP